MCFPRLGNEPGVFHANAPQAQAGGALVRLCLVVPWCDRSTRPGLRGRQLAATAVAHEGQTISVPRVAHNPLPRAISAAAGSARRAPSAVGGQGVEDLSLLLLAEAEEHVAGGREISAQERHRRVGSHPEGRPGGEARVPQEGELGDHQIAAVDELLGVGEVVLGTETDDLDLVCVCLGELPDLGAFTPAGGSMR